MYMYVLVFKFIQRVILITGKDIPLQHPLYQ